MEAITQKSRSKIKAAATIVAVVSFCLLLTSLFLHITFEVMAVSFFNFATHHYFLLSFISFIFLALSAKFYLTLDDRIDRNFRERHSLELSKDKRKRKRLLNYFSSVHRDSSYNVSKFINGDDLKFCDFTDADVLADGESKLNRQRDIQKATVLGSIHKQKVIILFSDRKAKKHLITSVLQSSLEYIHIKGGVLLPIRSIYKIEF